MELIFSKYKFNIQNGLINCIVGSVKLDDIIDIYSSQYDIGFVIHPLINQIFHKNVNDYLNYMLDISNHKDKKKIVNSLKMVGLDSSYLNRKFDSLSCSEIYKVMLASALIINPRILILDNPNAYLDFNSMRLLVNIIRTMKRRYNKTIIIFSNNSDFIHSIADYIFVIGKDNIVLAGDKYAVFNDRKVLNKYHIDLPKVVEFEKRVELKKGINIGLRDNINDLLKDIYYFK